MSEPRPATRRVVTGKDANGIDGIIDDRHIDAAETRGGNRVSMIWSASELPPRRDELEDPDNPAWTKKSIPEKAGARWSMAHIPPLSSRSAAEVGNAVGMHVTETLDFILIVDGDLWMVMPSGDEVHLHAGDCVVQRGTEHRWENRGDRPVVMCGVLLHY